MPLQWTLGLRRASETLPDAHARISADRDAAVAFLRKQGFPEAEIERQPTRTVDKLAREYGVPVQPGKVIALWNNFHALADKLQLPTPARLRPRMLAKTPTAKDFGSGKAVIMIRRLPRFEPSPHPIRSIAASATPRI